MTHRYTIQYGYMGGYIVWDTEKEKAVFNHGSKSECIAEAQRQNKFEPVDGSEATYAKQIGLS